MRRPFSGEVNVHHRHICVASGPYGHGPLFDEAFAGQSVGLCGAAQPGALWLSTGPQTGRVGLAVEVHAEPPPLDRSWEEIVEVSFRPLSAHTLLLQWGGENAWDLGLEQVSHRVRYSAVGVERGRGSDTRRGGSPEVDRYLLQFWPDSWEPARLVRQTSETAAQLHAHARQTPPTMSGDPAKAPRISEPEWELERQRRRLVLERARWGGRLPGDALRHAWRRVGGLVRFDVDLVHAVAGLGSDRQRGTARWVARRACAQAGLVDLEWMAPALRALDRGQPLPPPFDDWRGVLTLLGSDERVPHKLVQRAIPPRPVPAVPPPDPADDTATTLVSHPACSVPSEDSTISPKAGVYRAVEVPEGESARSAATPQVRSRLGRYLGTVLPGDRPTPTAESDVPGVASTSPTAQVAVVQSHMALSVLFAAAHADPLYAALDAITAGIHTYGEDHPAFLAEVWAMIRES